MTVTLDRPPVNAVTATTFRELETVFSSFHDDRDVRAVIFTAAGTRAFMAGADLRSSNDEARPRDTIDVGVAAREALWAVYDCVVPVVAAINGPAIGAGVAFAALCDIIVSSEDAIFATKEIDVGLLGAGAQLSLLVPRHKARELYLTGAPITAQELHALGSVSRVVASDQLLDAAHDLAAMLAAKSPIALRLAKEVLNRTEFLPLKDAYRMEQDYTNRLLTFEDSREAKAAYLEKRDPRWSWH